MRFESVTESVTKRPNPLFSASQRGAFEKTKQGSPRLASTGGMALYTQIPPLTDDERAALMLEVRRAGEREASRRLGLSRNLMARALARLKIQAGSVLLIRNALATVTREAKAA